MTIERFDDFALVLHPSDSVAVLKRAVAAGTILASAARRLTAAADIPAGHKIALVPLRAGAAVTKYGQTIGFAAAAIAPGEHVHTQNLAMRDFGRDYQSGADYRVLVPYPPEAMRHFPGYLRPDGRVGTRNYVALIATVNCSAGVCQHVRERFRGPDFARQFPHVDGVVAFTHASGCCNQPGQATTLFQRVLTGMARHPNVFGYALIGLGCEGSSVATLRHTGGLDVLPPAAPAPVFLNIQELGGVRKTIAAATNAVAKLCAQANDARRTQQPVSKLALALNCGGSDGNSGITANPALGVASDELVRHGGISVLGETPEIYGAEHLLVRRAASPEVGAKLIAFIRWWEEHVRQHGASIDNNPSPGNKAGGLTTIYEKSLGAVAKGGQAPLVAVHEYAQRVDAPGSSAPGTPAGLAFMDTPGFDPVSMTGLVAGGCNVGVFTTGRGSVYGCKPAPCIKVATNTPLYEHMSDDMDLNAGTILDGTETVEQVGQRIFEKIIAVAGGEKTKSDAQNLGDEEFAPWLLGPTF